MPILFQLLCVSLCSLSLPTDMCSRWLFDCLTSERGQILQCWCDESCVNGEEIFRIELPL